MRGLLFALVIFFTISPSLRAEENLVYSISFSYGGSALYLESVRLMEGEAPDRKTAAEEGFLLKVIGDDGSILHSFHFTIELQPVFQPLRKDAPPPPSPGMEPGYATFVVTVPYFGNAKSIEIYDPQGNLALTIDVSRFSKKKPKTGETSPNVPPAGSDTGGNLPQIPRGGDDVPLSLGLTAVGAWILKKFWGLFMLAGLAAAAYWIYDRRKKQQK